MEITHIFILHINLLKIKNSHKHLQNNKDIKRRILKRGVATTEERQKTVGDD